MGTYVGKLNNEDLKNRNLRFYKILGQNYETLVNAILRGKDINYEIPDCYKMNTKNPYILDWLLEYGRPSQISQVRRMGPVKLKCMYNALLTWVDKNPSDEDKWKYWEEWEEFFSKDRTQYKKKKTVTDVKKEASSKEVEPKIMPNMLPELKFVTKKGNFRLTNGSGDVYISINKKRETANYTSIRIIFHFRNGSYKKLGNSEYAVFSLHKNRIYFKSANAEEGFKLTTKSKNGGCSVFGACIPEKDIHPYKSFLKKELKLKYDDLYELYYVEIPKEDY